MSRTTRIILSLIISVVIFGVAVVVYDFNPVVEKKIVRWQGLR